MVLLLLKTVLGQQDTKHTHKYTFNFFMTNRSRCRAIQLCIVSFCIYKCKHYYAIHTLVLSSVPVCLFICCSSSSSTVVEVVVVVVIVVVVVSSNSSCSSK